MPAISDFLLSVLACPYCETALTPVDDGLRCAGGHDFPVVQGVPVMLRHDGGTTFLAMQRSRDAAWEAKGDARESGSFYDTLGLNDAQIEMLTAGKLSHGPRVDPAVAMLIGATSGNLYAHLVGQLPECPVPEIRLAAADGESFLDVGCSWGRWLFAARRKGFRVVGVDPSLGAALAARRQGRLLGIDVETVVADARHLPMRKGSFDCVYSYSVLQHLSRRDAGLALQQIGKVLKPGGRSLVQMASAYGLRSAYNRMRRGWHNDGSGFDVRYWTPRELRSAFAEQIGPTQMEADGFFGLGVQPADYRLMTRLGKTIIIASEVLRAASRLIPPLGRLADSQFLRSTKT